MSLQCAACGEDTSVIDSRTTQYYDLHGIIRRRRECSNCKHRFTTYEVTEEVMRKFVNLERSIADLQGHMRALAGLPMIPEVPALRGVPVPKGLLKARNK